MSGVKMGQQDIVGRLRDLHRGNVLDTAIQKEAADEIERLRADNAALKAEVEDEQKWASHYAQRMHRAEVLLREAMQVADRARIDPGILEAIEVMLRGEGEHEVMASRDALRAENAALLKDARAMAAMLDIVQTLDCGPDYAALWWQARSKFVAKYAALAAGEKQNG